MFLTLHSFGCGKKDYICKLLRKLNLSYTVLQKAKKKKKEKKDHLCKRPAESSERLLFGWIYCLAERQRPLSLESSIS